MSAWSYSRLSLYEQCPRRYKHKNIDKLDDVRNEAMERGDRVHKGVAAYLIGQPIVEKGITYGPELRHEAKAIDRFEPVFNQIKANDPVVEQQWAFTPNWGTSTSWFGKDTWYRNILDAGVLWPDNSFTVIDWKTGKAWGSNQEQMEQFAISVFARYPQVHFVETRLEYLDTGQEQHGEFTRSEAPALKRKWADRAAPLLADKTFAPRPGSYCKKCPFGKSKAGPCPFG